MNLSQNGFMFLSLSRVLAPALYGFVGQYILVVEENLFVVPVFFRSSTLALMNITSPLSRPHSVSAVDVTIDTVGAWTALGFIP